MSVHSTHYTDEAEYRADLAWEYRGESQENYDCLTCRDCASWNDCLEQYKEAGYFQCETGEKYIQQFEDAISEGDG